VYFPEQNQGIFRTVDRLLKDGGRLIHVSTQAVFGLAVDWPIQFGPVSARRDDPYVEAKIEAEKHFEDRQKARGQTLEIVRPGNVWGRASGAWALPIVQRLLTGRPIGLRGVPGFSNATDVANVAAYLIHLLQADRTPGIHYHHLAEFSAIPWSRWVAGVARELDVEPIYVEPDVASMRVTAPRELALAFASFRPRQVYRRLAAERTAGSWARSALRLLPKPLFSQLKGPEVVFAGAPENDRAERIFLAIMGATQEFKSQVLPGWRPPLTEAESMARVVDWLRAG
jgi:nucleoside-diphosphate-sugar epimerase